MADHPHGSIDGSFWAALGRGTLALPQCVRCGEWIWPARPICAACHGFDIDWVEVEPRGRVHSWTRTWYPFVPERAGSLPYVVVVAELPHAGGSRVLGVLDDDGTDDGDPADTTGAVPPDGVDGPRDPAIGDTVVGRIVPAAPETLGFPSLRWMIP